jgi:hypothetical protein
MRGAVAHQHHPHLLRVAARQLTTCSSAAALSLHQLSSSCTLLGPATPFQLGIAARFLSSSAPQDGSKQQPPKEEVRVVACGRCCRRCGMWQQSGLPAVPSRVTSTVADPPYPPSRLRLHHPRRLTPSS